MLLNSASRPQRWLGCMHIKRRSEGPQPLTFLLLYLRLLQILNSGPVSNTTFLQSSTHLTCRAVVNAKYFCTPASSLTTLRFVLFWITLLRSLSLDNPLVLSGTAPPAFFLPEVFFSFPSPINHNGRQRDPIK